MTPAGEMPDRYLDVCLAEQRLALMDKGRVVHRFAVSTARNGPGELRGSECTPRGWHTIRAKIGAGQPLGAVFVGRRPTGEVYSETLRRRFPERDWILTRILWLGGLEAGVNRYGNVDTTWRFIYIHGGPDETIDGSPGSHGCVRLRNADMLALFDMVLVGDRVFIH